MKLPPFVKDDPWLQPYAPTIISRLEIAMDKEREVIQTVSLKEFSQGHKWYGLHHENNQWVIRDWAPNATSIYLIGDFNNWQETPEYAMSSIGNGNWELYVAEDKMAHGDHFIFTMYWEGGHGRRIPAWIKRLVQDRQTKLLSAKF